MKFLLECLSEEIPVQLQHYAQTKIEPLMKSIFTETGIQIPECKIYVTYRRIVFHATLLEDIKSKYVKGPEINAHEKAIEGFKKKMHGCRIYTEEIKDKTYYHAELPKINITESVKNSVLKFLESFVWPKSMRWETSNQNWVRPLRSILLFLDDNILDLEFAEVRSSNFTFGNRFLSPSQGMKSEKEIYGTSQMENAVKIDSQEANSQVFCKSIAEYFALMASYFVLLDTEKRKQHVIKQFNKIKCTHNLDTKLLYTDTPVFSAEKQKNDPREISDSKKNYHHLLERMFYVSEYPILFVCKLNLDAKYIQIPDKITEVIAATHQKYISCYKDRTCYNPTKTCMTHFIGVANYVSPESVEGHRKSLIARLDDADSNVQEVMGTVSQKRSLARKDLIKNCSDAHMAYDNFFNHFSKNCTIIAQQLKLDINDTRDLHKIMNNFMQYILGEKLLEIVSILSIGITIIHQISPKDKQDLLLKTMLAATFVKQDYKFRIVADFQELKGTAAALYFDYQNKRCELLLDTTQLIKNILCSAEFREILEEQYKPESNSSPCPKFLTSRIIGIADRIVLLNKLFQRGAKYNGGGDQYGIKRIATGIIKLILEYEEKLDLNLMICTSLYKEIYRLSEINNKDAIKFIIFDKEKRQTMSVVIERFLSFLQEKAIDPRVIQGIKEKNKAILNGYDSMIKQEPNVDADFDDESSIMSIMRRDCFLAHPNLLVAIKELLGQYWLDANRIFKQKILDQYPIYEKTGKKIRKYQKFTKKYYKTLKSSFLAEQLGSLFDNLEAYFCHSEQDDNSHTFNFKIANSKFISNLMHKGFYSQDIDQILNELKPLIIGSYELKKKHPERLQNLYLNYAMHLPEELNFFRLLNLANLINDFISTDEGTFVIAVHKRVYNMLCSADELESYYDLDDNIPIVACESSTYESSCKDLLSVLRDIKHCKEKCSHDILKIIHELSLKIEEFLNTERIACDDEEQRKINLSLLIEFIAAADEIFDFSSFID